MAARFGRGAVLKVATGAATPGSPPVGTPTNVVSGLQDTTLDLGIPQFVDTTNHATPGLGTSETVSHTAKGTLTATFQYDATDPTHVQMAVDQAAAVLKCFSLHDSTTGTSPGKRWRWNGYYGGTPFTFPVSGISTGNLTVSIEPGWVYEDDV